MSGLITSVVPVSSDWFYYGACGVTHLEYSAGAINTTDKQSALSSAIESVVLGDTRCEQHPVQAASLLLFRGRPGRRVRSGKESGSSRSVRSTGQLTFEPTKEFCDQLATHLSGGVTRVAKSPLHPCLLSLTVDDLDGDTEHALTADDVRNELRHLLCCVG